MADYPVVDSDMVQFMPNFAAAVVVVLPGNIKGTGKTVAGKKLCLEGDESSVKVAGCVYISPPFVAPGSGTITIAKLQVNQLSMKTTDSGKKIILKGANFVAKFKVDSPAKDMVSGASDPSPSYPGLGQFITTNFKTTIG